MLGEREWATSSGGHFLAQMYVSGGLTAPDELQVGQADKV